jgi:hypothetical protein
VNPRLTAEQIAEAETAFHRLAGKPLSSTVEGFLTNYRPPRSSVAIAFAALEWVRKAATCAAFRRSSLVSNLPKRSRAMMTLFRAIANARAGSGLPPVAA